MNQRVARLRKQQAEAAKLDAAIENPCLPREVESARSPVHEAGGQEALR